MAVPVAPWTPDKPWELRGDIIIERKGENGVGVGEMLLSQEAIVTRLNALERRAQAAEADADRAGRRLETVGKELHDLKKNHAGTFADCDEGWCVNTRDALVQHAEAVRARREMGQLALHCINARRCADEA